MAQVQAQSPQPGAAALTHDQLLAPPLYVGDLEPNVSEDHLYAIFSQIGAVVSIRVCRDGMTRRSLEYAYVNYSSAEDAMRALDVLNFTPVRGKPIRIMYSNRDSRIRNSGAANIFIKNLHKSLDTRALYDTFINFGSILSCKVATDGSGQSRGYGFVQFEQDQDAQTAIVNVNGMLLNDKQVFVGPFVRRQQRDQAIGGASTSKFNNVYVKNLADSTTDEELRKAFGAYGNISSAVVMRDVEGKSKCFGFVNFERAEDAARAVAELNGKQLDDKEWYVGRAQKKYEREAELRAKFERKRQATIDRYQGMNLYLKHLDDNVDDEKLGELFADFGTITSCKVMRDPQGRSKGSGFVAFSAPEEATRAISEMDGRMVGTKPLYVALAQRKEERRAMLTQLAQFAPMRTPVGVGPAVNMPMYQGVNLHLKHLDDNVDDENLGELFGDFGTITSCKVMRDPQGRSRGFGFVALSTPEEASRAISKMNGRMVGTELLYVALAQRKEERRAILTQQAHFASLRTPVGAGPAVPTSMPMYNPAPGLGQQIFYGQHSPGNIPPQPTQFGCQQQIFYGQHPPGIIPPQPTQFGDQQQMIRMRPGPGGAQMQPNSFVPVVQRHPRQRGKRAGGRRGNGGPQQQAPHQQQQPQQ